MADLEVRNVHKSYGATAVIHGVSVAIRDGEFVVLVSREAEEKPQMDSHGTATGSTHVRRSPESA